ncbi:MAG: hypothetical protein ACXWJM_03405, partial [Ramlibacter sp.]
MFPRWSILRKNLSHLSDNSASNAKTYLGSGHTLCSSLENGTYPALFRAFGPQGWNLPPDPGDKTSMNAPLPEHIRKALETVTLDDK